MKKILCLTLCALVIITLSCCGEKNSEENLKKNEKENVKETPKQDTVEEFKFENELFLGAFATAIGKNPEEVALADAENVHYIAIVSDENGKCELCVADGDAMKLLIEGKNDDFANLIKVSEIDKSIDFAKDLGKFPNVELVELINVPVSDLSFVNNYGKLITGVFNNNGITDVSTLAGYNPESLVELDFTGNSISDWSGLNHIKEKVIVLYDANKGIIFRLDSVFTNTTDVEETQSEDLTPDNTEETKEAPAFVDENGNPVDFSSLFE